MSKIFHKSIRTRRKYKKLATSPSNSQRFFFSVMFIRLQAMKREIHLRELQLLDAVRRRFMHHQQTLKETELQRLDDDIERKVSNKQTAS